MKSVLALSGVALLLAAPGAALAQPGAMVQATPPALAVERLNQNLTRLSRAPTDMEALIGAGMASYELGDAQAANGFFTRANMVNPRDGRVKLGLALVSLSLKQPREAADYFDQATQLGEPATAYLGDRALAYDLVGQQDKAQQDYAAAIRANPGKADLVRGYAISLGVSGRLADADAALRPLLSGSDRAAWRDRTMILAMNGHTAEAHKIAQTIMPRALSDALDPYLLRMAALTPAQKAAAAHLGQFPTDGMRLSPTSAPPPVQTASVPDSSTRHHKKDRETKAATTGDDDNTLAAAMPHADGAPTETAPTQMAMVQPVPQPAQPVVQPLPPRKAEPAFARTKSRAAPASPGDDDPDGWSAADRQRYARAQSQTAVQAPVQTVQAVPTPPKQRAMVEATPPVAVAATPAQAVASATPTPLTPARPSVPVRAERPAITPSYEASPVEAYAARVNRPSLAPATEIAATPPPITAPVQTSAAPPASYVAPQPVLTPPAPAPAPSAQPRTLAEIMAGIQVPDAERTEATPAVDLAEVARMQAEKHKADAAAAAKVAADKAKKEAAAKAKAEADAKAKAEAEEKARIKANPSRYWVQVATGRDPDALAFDMRRLRKTYSPLSDESGYTAEWGATRRLLVGPFATPAKAKSFDGELKKAGADSFVYQSEPGEVVAELSARNK